MSNGVGVGMAFRLLGDRLFVGNGGDGTFLLVTRGLRCSMRPRAADEEGAAGLARCRGDIFREDQEGGGKPDAEGEEDSQVLSDRSKSVIK